MFNTNNSIRINRECRWLIASQITYDGVYKNKLVAKRFLSELIIEQTNKRDADSRTFFAENSSLGIF